MIKTLLIASGKINPSRELVFVPAGVAKAIKTIASILVGRDGKFPVVLLDGDGPGENTRKELEKSVYVEDVARILSTNIYAYSHQSEIEDLIPITFLKEGMKQWQGVKDPPFSQVKKADEPTVNQLEQWIKKQGLQVPKHWKVELAIDVKQQALNRYSPVFEVPGEYMNKWLKLFQAFIDQDKWPQ